MRIDAGLLGLCVCACGGAPPPEPAKADTKRPPVDAKAKDAKVASKEPPRDPTPEVKPPPTAVPAVVDPAKDTAGPVRATQISVGRGHTCARMSDDSMRCVGDNSWGQLGAGDVLIATKQATPPLHDVVEVAAGGTFTCARRRDRTVSCWGYNHVGQLGLPASSDPITAPTAIAGVTGAVAITAAESHACALRDDGTVWCWGENRYHGLGDGSTDTRVGPVQVVGLDGVTMIAGDNFTCARRVDGSVWCWGMNHADTAAPIASAVSAVEIAVGGNVACTRDAGGSLACWGPSDSGQLARGDATDGEAAASIGPVAGVRGATAVSVGQTHGCAIVGDGTLCWGDAGVNPAFDPTCLRDTQHRGGGGSPAQWKYCATPTAVAGLPPLMAIDVGGGQPCGLTATGEIWCWGGGAPAQLELPTGTTTPDPTPDPAADPCSGATLGLGSAKPAKPWTPPEACAYQGSGSWITSDAEARAAFGCDGAKLGVDWKRDAIVVSSGMLSPAQTGSIAYDDGAKITVVSRFRNNCPDDPQAMPAPFTTMFLVPKGPRTFAEASCTTTRTCK